MRIPERQTLAVVGAGPKGIAVAVKAKVLQEFGFPVDQVVLIEKNGVAAHWSGEYGYTNGEMKLGTSPEKDVVFPIESELGDAALARRVRQRLMDFTWGSFLMQTQRFSGWVDRGRPAPCHQLWAAYLRWVSEQLAPHVPIVPAEVVRIDLDAGGMRWALEWRDSKGAPDGQSTLIADRLMLTGPGKIRTEFAWRGPGALPAGAYDIESFWAVLKSGELPASGRLAVVGAGENAASILLAIGERAPGLSVDVIAPRGFVSTRAENFYENRFYSQPLDNGWRELALPDRASFIERTDLGVFSVQAMRILNEEARHRIVPGRLVELRSRDGVLTLEIDYDGRVSTRSYDHAILATGFDQTATIRALFSARAVKAIECSVGATLSASALAGAIGKDLSIRGLTPRLHLPALAGLMQGPGFSNLSCLGLLSDRVVLGPVLEKLNRVGPEAAEFRADHLETSL